MKEKLVLWDTCCGANGKMNAEHPFYKDYMKARDKKKALEKQKK